VLNRNDFQRLLDGLRSEGYKVVGPVLRNGSVVYDELTRDADMPVGWVDEQSAGQYRLRKRADEALFGYAVGPHSAKQFLHPAAASLWQGVRAGMEPLAVKSKAPTRHAFVGLRACDLAAIRILDKVLIEGPYPDPVYGALRRDSFIVAVNCTSPGGTCFCVSMNTGPRVLPPFDLALTELLDNGAHRFLVDIGSERGADLLKGVPHHAATDEDVRAAETCMIEATSHMGRRLDTNDLRDILYAASEHPQWKDVAARCLSCANCTMVCPTCFCTSVEDVTDLKGETAQRSRRWDSCFTLGFSYIHGGSIRASALARYRQWLTHKLATWVDQFGTMGCVGCGRCITWCPVGIDITAEAAAIRTKASVRET